MPTLFGELLKEARERVMKLRHDKDGVVCPCCDQFAKVYRRKLNSTMARGLMWLAANTSPDGEFIHVNSHGACPRWLANSGDFAKLRFWKLIEEMPPDEDEDKPHSGFWRITTYGKRFVYRKVNVPSHVYIYNQECLDFDGDLIDIEWSIGQRFSYRELMSQWGLL